MCEIVEEVSPIVPYLYLGSHKGLTRSGLLEEYSIKDVITVVSKQEWEALKKRFCVEVNQPIFYDKHDDDMEDMLTLFPMACQQIALAVTEKRPIFVHCMQGISRSSTIVAAYLMASRSWPADQALDFLKTRRVNINPNANFRWQLSIWEALKWRLNMNNPILRNYLINMIAMSSRDFPDKLHDHLKDYLKIVKKLEKEWGKQPEIDFVCRNCSVTLFHKRNIIKAEQENDQTKVDEATACEYYLVEPIYWMKKKAFKINQEKPLICLGCSTQVGVCYFSNKPFQLCNCLEHQNLTPMKIKLAINKNKLNETKPLERG